jgi:hypothetical protein
MWSDIGAADWPKPSGQMKINEAARVATTRYREKLCVVLQYGRKAASAGLRGF